MLSLGKSITPEQGIRLERFIAALRSGEYKQTHGMLKRPTEIGYSNDNGEGIPRGFGYCCLGVMCDVAVRNGWSDGVWYGKYSTEFISPRDDRPGLDHDDVSSMPPKDVLELFGLPEEAAGQLVLLNDGGGLTFVHIAAVLEQALVNTKRIPVSEPLPTMETLL